MPKRCLVCDCEVNKLYSYTQDHVPIVGPFFHAVRTTEVSLPYCDEHEQIFRRRFRRLRISQGLAFAVLGVSCATLINPEFRTWIGWNQEPGPIEGALCAVLFLYLVASIFCIKPFLYDAFIKRRGNRLTIKSGYPTFIRSVIEANRDIVVEP